MRAFLKVLQEKSRQSSRKGKCPPMSLSLLPARTSSSHRFHTFIIFRLCRLRVLSFIHHFQRAVKYVRLCTLKKKKLKKSTSALIGVASRQTDSLSCYRQRSQLKPQTPLCNPPEVRPRLPAKACRGNFNS